MIAFREIADRFGDRPLFIGKSGTTSYAEFLQRIEGRPEELETLPVTAIPLEWNAESIARFFRAMVTAQCVFPGEKFPEGDLTPFLSKAPLLVLKTGGSSGQPRHVVHSVERFLEKYVLEDRPAKRHLVLYAPDHMAGLDAILKAMHQGGTLVIPESRTAWAIAKAIEEQSVEVLPATPSMLQFLLLSGELKGRDLTSVSVIPHGAEPMAESLRQRVHQQFPQARLLQRFGMTELGALPVREDPDDPRALYLEAANHTWKVEDGELHIWSPGRMLGILEEGLINDSDPWFRTGDLAERTARGSIRILGRQDSIINVGGEKVLPELVEEMMLALPAIRDAEVFAVPNPMTGQAVAVRIVSTGEYELVDILSDMRSLAREKGYPLAWVPTRVEFVSQISMTESGKRSR